MTDPYSPYPQGTPLPPTGAGGTPGVAKAAVALMALSVLAVAVAAIGGVALTSPDEFARQFNPEQMRQFQESGLDERSLRTFGIGLMAACAGVYALIYLVLAPFVWGTRKWAVITALVIASLLLLFQGGGLLLSLLVLATGAAGDRGPTAGNVLLNALPVPLHLGTLIALILCLRHRRPTPGPGEIAAQHAAWQQYYQQQQPPPQTPSQHGWPPPQG